MLESLAAPLRSVLVVADPASGAIYAATAKSLAQVHEWVVTEVTSKGALDQESELLFCSMVRRHDMYKAVFSDLPSEVLRVGYGPSLQAPKVSNSLYIHNPESPYQRLDVSAKSLAESLKEPTDASSIAMIRNRLQQAVRNETRSIRKTVEVMLRNGRMPEAAAQSSSSAGRGRRLFHGGRAAGPRCPGRRDRP